MILLLAANVGPQKSNGVVMKGSHEISTATDNAGYGHITYTNQINTKDQQDNTQKRAMDFSMKRIRC